METKNQNLTRIKLTEEEQRRMIGGDVDREAAPREVQRHGRIRWIVQAALLCLLVGVGCRNPLSDLGEERTITLRLRGTVTSAADGSAIDGASVMLIRSVLATDTSDELLAQTEVRNGGTFSINRQARCSLFTILRVRVAAPGYSPASEFVGCRDAEQSFSFVLAPSPSGN